MFPANLTECKATSNQTTRCQTHKVTAPRNQTDYKLEQDSSNENEAFHRGSTGFRLRTRSWQDFQTESEWSKGSICWQRMWNVFPKYSPELVKDQYRLQISQQSSSWAVCDVCDLREYRFSCYTKLLYVTSYKSMWIYNYESGQIWLRSDLKRSNPIQPCISHPASKK